MPNWCCNKLTVENVTESFIDFIREHGFSFEAIAPLEKLNSNDDQLALQNETWGTKWDLDDEEKVQVGSELIVENVVEFNTAWSPPMGVIEALTEKFPKMDFRLDYFEQGCWFAGTIFASGGLVIDDVINDDNEISAFAQDKFDWEPIEDEDENLLEDSDDVLPSLGYSTTPCLSCQENNLFDPEDID